MHRSLLFIITLIPLLLCACISHPPGEMAAIHSTDLKGQPVNPLANLSLRRATVLIFITNDCPISNAFAPEIERLCSAYSPQGIAIYVVYADPDLTLAEARKHHQEYNYTGPALLDVNHDLARYAGATVTPEAAVFLPNGHKIYQGRINDLYIDYGKARFQPTTHDLKEVLESIVQNHPIGDRITKAVGCPIPM